MYVNHSTTFVCYILLYWCSELWPSFGQDLKNQLNNGNDFLPISWFSWKLEKAVDKLLKYQNLILNKIWKQTGRFSWFTTRFYWFTSNILILNGNWNQFLGLPIGFFDLQLSFWYFNFFQQKFKILNFIWMKIKCLLKPDRTSSTENRWFCKSHVWLGLQLSIDCFPSVS